MAGKPPTAVRAPAKATFKHSLPSTVGENYFAVLQQHVTANIPDYHNEYEKVCYDILKACQMASTGFSTEAKLGPATPNVATGKSLYSPQRDQYNGPLQAFLQHPLSALGRPNVWQHWVKNRDTLVEDFSLFAKKCFRNEAEVVDAPIGDDAGSPLGSRGRSQSFHGGVLSPPNGSFSGSFNGSFNGGGGGAMSPQPAASASPASNAGSPNANSGAASPAGSPQRKLMMRPGTAQATSRETSSSDTFIRCGTNSFFDPERLVLVHIWANPRAARTFVQSWRRLAQITFEHRLDMIHCPISVVNCIESTFVSVTALPPVLDTVKSPPLRNVGASRGSDEEFESLIQRMGRQLLEVLSSDATDIAHTKGQGLTLYPGIDGRYYLMNLHFNLHPKFHDKELSAICQPRPELVYMKVENKMFEETFDSVLNDHALPKSLRILHDMLNDPSFTVDVVIRDSLVGLCFHQNGVNMKCLGRALKMVESGVLKLPNPTAVSQLRVVLITEMMGRTFKHLMRLDCMVGAAGTQADRDLTKTCNNTKLRLSVVNRLARLAVAKDASFMTTNVLPILRQKFGLPADFSTDWTEVNPGTCLKILSAKLGCEFGAAEGRFHKFVESSSKDLVMLACNAPLEAVLCEDKEAGLVATNQFWTQCLSIPSDSTLYESFLIRASAMSVITNAHLGRIPVQLVDGTSQAEANAMAPVFLLQLAGVLFEHMCKQTKTATAATRFLAALRDHMVEVDSRRESGNSITPEATYNSLKHIAAAPLVEKFQLVSAAKSGNVSEGNSQSKGGVSPQLSARGGPAKVDPTILENGVKYFVDQPHVDFTFSSLHSQAVRDLESMIPLMDTDQLEHFIRETVDAVAENLNRADRRTNATRYYQRVAVQLVGVSLAEKSPAAAKMMRETYSMSVRQFGIEDARTSVALYLQCLFALKLGQTESTPPSVGTAANQCRKIYEKAMSLGPVDQKAFYQTATVFTVLQRVLVALETICDSITVRTLKPHIKLLTNLHGAMMMIQKTGRGYIVRKRRANGFQNFPTPPAKLASLGILPGVIAGAGGGGGIISPRSGEPSAANGRSGGTASLPTRNTVQHGFGYNSFAIQPGQSISSFIQSNGGGGGGAGSNNGGSSGGSGTLSPERSSSVMTGMPPLPPPPLSPNGQSLSASNTPIMRGQQQPGGSLTGPPPTNVSLAGISSAGASQTTSPPTGPTQPNASFTGSNSFRLPKGPPPLPPALSTKAMSNTNLSTSQSLTSPKSDGGGGGTGDIEYSVSGLMSPTLGAAQSPPQLKSPGGSRVQFAEEPAPTRPKVPMAPLDGVGELVVESLDDESPKRGDDGGDSDDEKQTTTMTQQPAIQNLLQRKHTFSRGGGGLGAGRLRNSSFTGGAQATNNAEFGTGQGGQSSGVFGSPSHRGSRRRLNLEGSVNEGSPPQNVAGGGFGSSFNGGLAATGSTPIVAGRRAGQLPQQTGSPSGNLNASTGLGGSGTYGGNLDVDFEDDDDDQNDSLFRLCDLDQDGLVSATDCAHVFTQFSGNGRTEAQLRSLFSSATKNAKAEGKLNKKEFSIFIARAGL